MYPNNFLFRRLKNYLCLIVSNKVNKPIMLPSMAYVTNIRLTKRQESNHCFELTGGSFPFANFNSSTYNIDVYSIVSRISSFFHKLVL